MGHMWPNVTSGPLMAHIKMMIIEPDRTSGLLKARVLGRRIYGPSEFRPVKDPHRKWAQSHFRSFKGPCFLWARDIYTCKWPIVTEGPNYV